MELNGRYGDKTVKPPYRSIHWASLTERAEEGIVIYRSDCHTDDIFSDRNIQDCTIFEPYKTSHVKDIGVECEFDCEAANCPEGRDEIFSDTDFISIFLGGLVIGFVLWFVYRFDNWL